MLMCMTFLVKPLGSCPVLAFRLLPRTRTLMQQWCREYGATVYNGPVLTLAFLFMWASCITRVFTALVCMNYMYVLCQCKLLDRRIATLTATRRLTQSSFTFTLPCIVIDFFLNNQPDALIIQIYSVIKLYMFRVSSLPVIRSFLLYIRCWLVSCRFMMTASKQSQDRMQ